MKYLHTMIRVTDPAKTIAFFEMLGLKEVRRMENEKGRFTLIFLSVPGDEGAEVELTHNWDPEEYGEGRNFGHLAYRVDNIYDRFVTLIGEALETADADMAVIEADEHRGHLHPIVRRRRLAARQFLLVRAHADHRAPAAGARIALAGTVGEDLNLGDGNGSFVSHANRSSLRYVSSRRQ